jgi:ATP-binding protein involved in chromosome partitioning
LREIMFGRFTRAAAVPEASRSSQSWASHTKTDDSMPFRVLPLVPQKPGQSGGPGPVRELSRCTRSGFGRGGKPPSALAFGWATGNLYPLINMLTQENIQNALKAVKYPGYSRDVVSFGLIKEISAANGAVSVTMQLTSANPEAARQIKEESETVLKNLPGVSHVHVEVRQPAGGAAAPRAGASQNRVPGVKRVIAIASGKGGVGKSTCSVNIACALRHLGARVGLLDCDIYGPSIPLMMGIHQRPTVNEAEQLEPPLAHGIKVMSIGLLVEDDQPVIWRGPMITKTIQQFLMAVAWTDLDYLLVDLPPGTGDAQLSLCQTVPLDGGVIVTTPQEASLGVVRKGISMFNKVNVPILGLIENMSYFTTPNGERVEIFGHGGGKAEATRQKAPFLGEVPIFTAIREGGDQGTPIMISAPNHPASQTFLKIAQQLVSV